MSKKAILAVVVIAVVLTSSAGIALIAIKTGNDGNSGGSLSAPKDVMQEYVRSINAKEYSRAINATMYNFGLDGLKGNLTGSMQTNMANYSLGVFSPKEYTPDSRSNDAVQARTTYWEDNLHMTMENWTVLGMTYVVYLNGEVAGNSTNYALFFEIDGKWYLDMSSMTTSLDVWSQLWEKHVSLYLSSFIPTSKHQADLGISGSTELNLTIDHFKVIVRTSDASIDNSSSFLFTGIQNGSISHSPDWTSNTGNNLRMQGNAVSWLDTDNNGYVNQNDRIVITFDRYVPGTNYSFDLVYLTKNTTYGAALNQKLFDYVFPPTKLDIQMTQLDANSYKFVQVSRIYQDNAVSKIRFMMEMETISTDVRLQLNGSGMSTLVPGLHPPLQNFGINEDCITFHDVDGDGYVSQNDYFIVTFADGWNKSNNYLWINDGTYQSIFNYYW